MAAPKNPAMGLVNYFSNSYRARYGVAPTLNRFATRWVFEALITDVGGVESGGVEKAEKVIDYYFRTDNSTRHSIQWLSYNYDKLIEAVAKAEEDAEHRNKLARESAERARKWRERGNSGITSN